MDRVARVGGEEFGVILLQTHRVAGLQVAERIGAAIRADLIPIHAALALHVTISAGVAALPFDASTATELVSVADQALYAAKAAGRNRAIVFDGLRGAGH